MANTGLAGQHLAVRVLLALPSPLNPSLPGGIAVLTKRRKMSFVSISLKAKTWFCGHAGAPDSRSQQLRKRRVLPPRGTLHTHGVWSGTTWLGWMGTPKIEPPGLLVANQMLKQTSTGHQHQRGRLPALLALGWTSRGSWPLLQPLSQPLRPCPVPTTLF